MGKKRILALFVVIVASVALVAKTPDVLPAHAGVYSSYAVAADDVRASEAGARILAEGGTAADAAAATMLALGVVNPASSGIGGGGFALYYRAADQSFTFLDFRERAPAAATRTMFEKHEDAASERPAGPANSLSQLGGLAAGVPGEAAGVVVLVERFGALPLAQVVAPAVELAERAEPISEYVAKLSEPFAEQMRADAIMTTWLQPGAGMAPGTPLKRPHLARVLRALGERGMAGFYDGPIAREIVDGVRAHGGIMTLQDLRDYRVVTREPLRGTHFGHEWVTAPPPSAGGFTLLQSLAILERAIGGKIAPGVDLLHAMAESWKGPFADRQLYFGDPDHVILPIDRLMTETRVSKRAALAGSAEAVNADEYEIPVERPRTNITNPDNSGTSHLCAVDKDGNVAAVTTTVNLPFGARFTAGGIVMNDEMDDFASAVGVANAFGLVGGARNLPGPRKRPISTMTPTIVLEDGKPVLCVGAAGGSRIVTSTQQIAMNVLLLGMNAATAIDAPRIHHQGRPETLRVEKLRPLSEELQAALRKRGHEIDAMRNIGTANTIHIRSAPRRALEAAGDPRKGGKPAGR